MKQNETGEGHMADQSNHTKRLLAQVQALAQGRTGSKRSIAQLLMNEGSGLTHLSMAEIAQLSFSSKPSLVRFAQGLGFSGWRSFEEAYVEEMHSYEKQARKSNIDTNFPFDAETSLTKMAEHIARLEERAHHRVLEELNETTLRTAAQRMIQAQKIVYFGVAQNRFLGENLAFRYAQIGIDCLVPQEEDCELVARGMGSEHCALLVSYSGVGKQRQPAKFLPLLQAQGTRCVVVTNSGNNWLKHHSDCCLCFPPEEHLYSKIAGYYSEAATTFALDLLYSACFQANFSQNVQRKLDAVVAHEQRMQASDVLPE
ncbi:MurR/RpiR family transcriptional regulator [uncultured Olegusella sp.]|uniref:MurR/RpiR family transcriptional regulator n=1 Tax=uncultured Olegusella sp. TaxID=1979846 RepID=UPI002612A073|nr:MurR/RpiR family transcriptional regulator [uncultured Olegusella sp.]